ncbi:hypothetical protein [Blastomonas sp. UPD001]|uniref:hypothetical protein n=1 Tax=Blastomonas sp. UPD001 TaxID=2217673 RepID=UPI000E351B8E|nr:hypothetical protein [Blastomonas sp. UPD001]
MTGLRRRGGLPLFCAIMVALAMVNAPLARAQGRVLTMENCNGGTTIVVIPDKDDGLPKRDSDSDCAKAPPHQPPQEARTALLSGTGANGDGRKPTVPALDSDQARVPLPIAPLCAPVEL